jgi:acetyl-CoA carboxylase beta subunit
MPEDEKKTESAVSLPKKREKRGSTRTGELWAKCPECRTPVKDAELFKHLLNCPGADARQAEWKAQQAAAKQAQKTDPEAQAQ